MSELHIVDGAGRRLELGSRVRMYGYDSERDAYPEYHGAVVGFTDLDGDVNDYGRPVAILPTVCVRFDSGDEESFTAHSTARWHDEEDAPFQCEDLDLV